MPPDIKYNILTVTAPKQTRPIAWRYLCDFDLRCVITRNAPATYTTVSLSSAWRFEKRVLS